MLNIIKVGFFLGLSSGIFFGFSHASGEITKKTSATNKQHYKTSKKEHMASEKEENKKMLQQDKQTY